MAHKFQLILQDKINLSANTQHFRFTTNEPNGLEYKAGQFISLHIEKDGVEHTNDERGLKRKLASLRSFYRYLYKNEMIGQDPAVKVDMPKIHEKTITRLDIDEVANLLDEVESGESLTEKQQKFHEKTKKRDLAMMTLLLGTGIRVSECVGLDVEDLDFKNDAVKVTRKGGNEMFVYFGEEVKE